MGKSVLAVRAGLFSIMLFLLTAPCFAKQKGLPPLGREFIIVFMGTVIFIIVVSIKTGGFLWPLFAGLRSQARLLSAAHIILFLSCFLFCANIVIKKCHSSTDKIQTSIAVRVDKKTGPESNATFFSDAIVKIESFAGKSALPLFILGILLLLPGIYYQKKIDPEKYLERAIRNAIRSLAIGFLLIPGSIILYYFTHALTAFIRD